MKKAIVVLLIVALTISSMIGVTAVLSKRILLREYDAPLASSEIYEVVGFTLPSKTEYSLSDVYTVELSVNDDGSRNFIQQIDFDGSGMSVIIQNKETGESQTYWYGCEYHDGLKCEYSLTFDFEPPVNTELMAGEYTVEILLIAKDGECVVYNMPFSIIDDTVKETQAETIQEPTEKNSVTELYESSMEEVVEVEPTKQVQETECDEIVMPVLHTVWHNSHNSSGCTIEIVYQNGNELQILVKAVNEDGSIVAECLIPVTLENVYEDGIVTRGYGDFEYVDSLGNTGTGFVSVSENVIIFQAARNSENTDGWSLRNASGKYLW